MMLIRDACGLQFVGVEARDSAVLETGTVVQHSQLF